MKLYIIIENRFDLFDQMELEKGGEYRPTFENPRATFSKKEFAFDWMNRFTPSNDYYTELKCFVTEEFSMEEFEKFFNSDGANRWCPIFVVYNNFIKSKEMKLELVKKYTYSRDLSFLQG